jgi:hypothetical protein
MKLSTASQKTYANENNDRKILYNCIATVIQLMIAPIDIYVNKMAGML